MRVLVTTAPLIGHVFPLVPLARAVQAAGHDVLVATGGDAGCVRDAGLAVEEVGSDVRLSRLAIRLLLRHPLVARRELAGTAGTSGVSYLFGAVNARIAEGVLAIARRWRPDLVLHEPLSVAGALAAAELGVPSVMQQNMLFDGPTLLRVTAERMGVTVAEPAATISIAPPSVLPDPAGWLMRPVPYGGEGTLPAWLAEPADRPRVAVSHSTIAGPGNNGLIRRVVEAAAEIDAEFVLIRADRRVTGRPLPANVRTVDWVPMPALLECCAAVVHHGGAGTAFAALGAGIPQLVLNGPGDRRSNAQRIAARGAGLACDEREITAAALSRLLTDARLVSNATEVRDEIATQPAPEEVVPRIEALVA
jgi:UDP:flavonoid glycosyltransferase YjiC (YdhE family)